MSMQEGKKIVTFSFDDAFPKDEEVALLLEKYGFNATFYFPQNVKHGKIRDRMTVDQMVSFKNNHPSMEIGQHGFNHLFLTKVSLEEAVDDIQLGYNWHKMVFGEYPTAYAYPRGYYTETLAGAVEAIGYTCARTTVDQKKLKKKQYEIGGIHFPVDDILLTDKLSIWGHSWELGDKEMQTLETLLQTLEQLGYEGVTNTQYANLFYTR